MLDQTEQTTEQPTHYKRLRDIPADELAHRVVHTLILQKGNLNLYKELIKRLIEDMRKEYE